MKNKIQKVNFQDIDDFLDYLPEQERQVVDRLRAIVLSCLPDGREKLAYNVPFYYRHARICYIWPASVPWGGLHQGVNLGFCKGVLLSDEIQYLNKDNKKEIATIRFTDVGDIDVDLLKAYLYEAIELDEQAAREKRKHQRKPAHRKI